MATNKKKTQAAKAVKDARIKQKLAALDAKQVSSSSTDEAETKGFTNAQITALVFMGVGIMKLSEISTAVSQHALQPEHEDYNSVCKSFLDDETCAHEAMGSMIYAKYLSAVQLAWVVASVIRESWNSEDVLHKFNAWLCAAPLALVTLLLSVSNSTLRSGRIWQTLLMCLVLMSIAVPTAPDAAAYLKTLKDTKWNYRSPQAMCLIALSAMSALDVLKAVVSIIRQQPLQEIIVHGTSPMPHKSVAVVLFYLVDKIAVASAFLFPLLHFPNKRQRSFLLSIGILKAVEYFHYLPDMSHGYHDLSIANYSCMGAMIFSFVAWISPQLGKSKTE